MSRGLHIQEKHSFNTTAMILWLILIAVIILGGWYAYRFYTKGDVPAPFPVAATQQDVDETPVSPEAKDEHNVPSSYPRFLSIDDLGVTNSRVFAMGVADNGELDTPSNIFDTGWYQESALPGDGSGALLMDGHNGGPTQDGVFKQLPHLNEGSEIVIERGDGERFTYRTESVEIVPVEELNNGGMNDLSQSIDQSTQGLNIISCTGNWVPAQQTYDQRVIVRAALVTEN